MVLYIILNIVNVILQTVKSLVTVKCGKVSASVINALAYGFYTLIIIYTALDGISLLAKCVIVGACNLVGVFVVKLIEERMRKDRLWKVEMTYKGANYNELIEEMRAKDISCYYTQLNNGYTIINAFCKTQTESTIVNEITKRYNCKYFISESKVF